jgi:hypothetical protein
MPRCLWVLTAVISWLSKNNGGVVWEAC